MYRSGILISIVMSVVCAFGCSMSSESPMLTGISGNNNPSLNFTIDSTRGNVIAWGLYDISLNTGDWAVDVVPLRLAEFTVDVVTFMQPPAGTFNNLKLQVTDASEWADSGKISVRVVLTHPFPGLDQYTGHDVKGVLVSSGSIGGDYDSSVLYPDGVDDGKLLNPDGYTRWMNPVEFISDGTILNFVPGAMSGDELSLFTATINGYKYFADGLEDSQSVSAYYQNSNDLANRGQFRAGQANARLYDFQFPYDAGPILRFQYAVIAHWVEPTELIPGDIPGSFPPEANADEAIYLDVLADNSTLWYEDPESGGDISLQLEVFDWGGYFGTGGIPGEVSQIIIEASDAQNDPIPSDHVVLPSDTLTWQPGISGLSSVVSVEIPDCVPQGLDPVSLLIVVESSKPTSFDPGTGNSPTDSNLAGYFFYEGIVIGDEEPGPQVGTQVTDLSLKTNRVAGGTAVESLELAWTDTGDAQYAVYWDEEPYDNGGTPNIDYITPIAIIDASPAIVTDFDCNGGYVFTVRSRAVADDPSTESIDSNLALIEMENGGSATDTGNWTIGGNSIYTGRMLFQRGVAFGNGGWGWFVDNGYWANTCAQHWSAIATPQIPDIPSATEAFIEFAHSYYMCWQPGTYPSCNYPNNYPGISAGGASTAPPAPITGYDSHVWTGFDIYYNFPDDPPGGLMDEATIIEANNPSVTYFYGPPTVGAIWHMTDTVWSVSRVNAGLTDPSVDFAAVVTGANSFINNWSANEGHFYTDDIAVIVY